MIGRRGRPRSNRAKTNYVKVRLSDEEEFKLKCVCDMKDMNRSDVFRYLLNRAYDEIDYDYENY